MERLERNNPWYGNADPSQAELINVQREQICSLEGQIRLLEEQ